ncbi:uncharacterized protein [Ptychodera flava]|uniref:uncharacterized protein n=1 Tax=Ptychodera flava TaxID=63121 RepID=UPI00396A007E
MNSESMPRLLVISSCSFIILLQFGLTRSLPVESDDDSAENTAPSFRIVPALGRDNGMLKLVLHDLTERMIKDMAADEDTKLTESQMAALRDKIIGFYKKILNHPAINSDRVMFSTKKPDFNPNVLPAMPVQPMDSEVFPAKTSDVQPAVQSSILEDENELMVNESVLRKKKREQPFQEVCRSRSEFKKLFRGRTRTNTLVNLQEGQYFHVTTCFPEGQSCTGIADTYASACLTKQSWTIAYVQPVSEPNVDYDWDWISISTCCSCRIRALD